MKKEIRQKVYEKYKGLCAYTGKPLDDKWQVDHMTSKVKHSYITFSRCKNYDHIAEELKKVDHIDNLVPAISIVNHYKRGYDVEDFRHYMSYFHKRLAKLPKNPVVERSINRKKYMLMIAELFDITPVKPFSGEFYFEKLMKGI
jgi:hypothetical protein